MKNDLNDLKNLNLSNFSTSDLQKYKDPYFYNYGFNNGSLLLILKKQRFINLDRHNEHPEIRLENGSNSEELDNNECDIGIFDLTSRDPLLCLHNALKIVNHWKQDLKIMFPSYHFWFLVNYQHDNDAIISTFRFEVERTRKGVIQNCLDSINVTNSLSSAVLIDRI